MSKDLSATNKEELSFSDESMNHFKSLYYLLKGKRDSDIKLFNEGKQFNFSDLKGLNDKICKKLEILEVVTNMVNVTVGLDKNQIKHFGNWNSFISQDWDISERTRYVTMEWDFNCILPNQFYKAPQTHTIRIKIGNSLKPGEVLHVLFLGGEGSEDEELQSEMVLKIDFVNDQICNELKNIVTDWYNALPLNSAEHKLIRFVLSNTSKIQFFIALAFLISGIWVYNSIVHYLTVSNYSFIPSDSNEKLIFYLTASAAFIYTGYTIGELYADRVLNRTIRQLKRNPMFEITKGDRNKLIEIEKSNKSFLKQLLYSIIFALSSNFVAYLISLIIKYYTNHNL